MESRAAIHAAVSREGATATLILSLHSVCFEFAPSAWSEIIHQRSSSYFCFVLASSSCEKPSKRRNKVEEARFLPAILAR